MTFHGSLYGIQLDFTDSKPLLTLKLDSVSGLDALAYQIPYDIEIGKHRKRRSLDANSYFHVLNGKIAEALHISKSYCKNQLIARYGQMELLEGETVTYTSKAPPEYMLESESVHTCLISTSVKGDSTWYTYRLYRGSHTYDTKEMSVLIDGAVSEAQELGIDTIPPAELERILKNWHAKS